MNALLEKLDRNGAAVYMGGMPTPMVACWVGEKDGFFWYHLGDIPHWGPKLDTMKEEGETLTGRDGMGATFMVTTIENAPELLPGKAHDSVDAQRRIMTRDEAIAMLGTTPSDEG